MTLVCDNHPEEMLKSAAVGDAIVDHGPILFVRVNRKMTELVGKLFGSSGFSRCRSSCEADALFAISSSQISPGKAPVWLMNYSVHYIAE